MSTTTTTDACTSTTPTHRIGFIGDAGVGKTTVATLVAARLGERTDVSVTGDAAGFVTASGSAADSGDNALGIGWTVDDCPPGVAAIDARADRLDTVFVVATPETLDSVGRYADRARHHDVDCFVVVNRFRESARDDLRAFEGPPLAEYLYDDTDVSTAMADGQVPLLSDWTLEAILIEALQSDRQPAEQALGALNRGTRSIVNVEVDDRDDAASLLDEFEAAGFPAAYFGCNCRCHDGHVLAHQL